LAAVEAVAEATAVAVVVVAALKNSDHSTLIINKNVQL
jgi:hypothetical protein